MSDVRPRTINRPAILTLGATHAIGLNAMFGLVLRNGYVAALMSLRDNGPYLLPGSQHPILTTFTGIPPLDKLLTLGGVMFASVTSGVLPQLSLYGLYFGGQLVGIFTAMMVEGLRRGNAGTVMAQSVLWGCAMQTIGVGFVMPIYGIAHLVTSGTALEASTPLIDAADITDEEALKALPGALWLGYIFPTILMVAPIPWNALHQWLGGFWQGFPMWVALAQYVLVSHRHEATSGRPGKTTKRQPGDDEPLRLRTHSSSSGNRMSTMHTLQGVYWFAFKACAVSHWAAMGIIAANTLAPSWFPQRLRGSLSFTKVFWPPAFWNPDPMESMAHGIHGFFQYDLYVCTVAMLAWATALNVNTFRHRLRWSDWQGIFWQVAIQGFVAGPGGALVSLMCNRDERLLLGSADLVLEE